jgi:hypothetical protein
VWGVEQGGLRRTSTRRTIIKLEKCVDQTLYFREASLVGGELGDTWQIPCLQKFYIQHKDFVRLTIGSHGWTTIRATYHTQKAGASVCSSWIENFGTAQIKLPCLQQGLRLMSQTQPHSYIAWIALASSQYPVSASTGSSGRTNTQAPLHTPCPMRMRRARPAAWSPVSSPAPAASSSHQHGKHNRQLPRRKARCYLQRQRADIAWALMKAPLLFFL